MAESERVLVVGAGVGGLTAAIELAARGIEVTLLEKASRPGGKMREVVVAGRAIDAGPTVLTMRHVFDRVFAAAGERLEDHVKLDSVELLARHAWPDGSRLDLFGDMDRTAEAIGRFAGPREAYGYRRFCAYARDIHQSVEAPFLMAERPNLVSIVKAIGSIGLGALMKMDGTRTMWGALGDFFEDPRLLQLFGRYATYSGSSPFLAPATLNVIAHVEREGVWLVRGGMYRLAEALSGLAAKLGVTLRTGASVKEILVENGRAAGVRLDTGEVLSGRAVVLNADSAALEEGLFGKRVKQAGETPGQRSLSAMTWAVVGQSAGVPLVRHTVFFSKDYRREFRQLFEEGSVPDGPTVYICAQDRDDQARIAEGSGEGSAGERLFCLVNAPANGDRREYTSAEIERCKTAMNRTLSLCGLSISEAAPPVVTTPTDFARMFPATGGALYGAASHGWAAPFSRPAARSRMAGLYLCGGSVHPGAGVPMAAQSGRLVAAALFQDLASTSRSRKGAMAGGMSMR
jgi:1-hydroxycarotenoid 3,4-desaturase